MACDHKFVGTSDGVHCVNCQLTMTHEEYVAFISGEKTEKPKKTRKKKAE